MMKKRIIIAAALLLTSCKEIRTADVSAPAAEQTTSLVTEASAADTAASSDGNAVNESETSQITVSSSDLNDGFWDVRISHDKGEDISPELSWESVPDASCYAVYMVDPDGGHYIHMKAVTTDTKLTAGEIPAKRAEDGSNGLYIGPYPPDGVHTYNVYVFALKENTIYDELPGGNVNGVLSTLDEEKLLPLMQKNYTVLAWGSIGGKYPGENTSASAENTIPIYHTETIDHGTVKSYDDAAELFNGTFEYIVLDNEGVFPELAKAVTDEKDRTYEAFRERTDELSSMAKEDYEESPDRFTGEYAMIYSCNVNYNVMRSDEKIFSLYHSEEGYSGGAHGWHITTGVNFDAKSGQELTLSDVCADIPKLIDILGEKLEKDYPGLMGFDSAESGRELLTDTYGDELQGGTGTFSDGTTYEKSTMNFIFTPDGITFFSNSYDLGSYAEGTQDITILFSEVPGLFNEKYVSSGEDFFISTTSDVSFEENGELQSISVEYDYDETDWHIKGLTVKGPGKEEYFEYPADETDQPYLFTRTVERKNGKYTFRMFNSNGEKVIEAEF